MGASPVSVGRTARSLDLVAGSLAHIVVRLAVNPAVHAGPIARLTFSLAVGRGCGAGADEES